jgi:hypothetical protein
MSKHVVEPVVKCPRCEYQFPLHKAVRESIEVQVTRRIELEYVEHEAEQEERILKRAAEQHRLTDAAKDKQLADVRRQLEEAQRKAQQSSQQMQGEVAELDLESQLRHAFPLDQFETIGTGQRGADLLQRVVDQSGRTCGSIIWERKNAKNFSDAWIPKLRADQRESRADVAVLITARLPKDICSFGPQGRVWVASPLVAVPLGHALRSGLLEIANVRILTEGHISKQAALTEYVSSTQFRQRIEAMLDPTLALIEDFERERRSTETAWARRQKLQEQIIRSIGGLSGDFSGIMGILPMPHRLQLPRGDEAPHLAASVQRTNLVVKCGET